MGKMKGKNMKTLIIGAGAVGVAIGVSLAEEYSKIAFLTSEDTKKVIDANGVGRTGIFGSKHCEAGETQTYSNYSDLPNEEFDFIIVCTKTMANEATSLKISEHRSCLKSFGKIIIMQNGWGNEVPYLKYFDKDQVFNARLSTGFVKTSPNISDITVYAAPLLIGSINGCDHEILIPIEQILNENGIKTELTTQIEEALWAKMLYNTTLNPLGAILKVPYGKLIDAENSIAIMSDLIEETFMVMKAAGYKTFWKKSAEYKEVFFGKLVPETREHRSSTLQDIDKKNKTEIETLSGTVVRLGEKFGVDVSTHRMMYRLVRTMEELF